MLEKNKDYVEMCVSSTDCAFTQNAATQISVDGYVYIPYMRLPDPGVFYILISKEKFEKLQADVNINAETAKQWEINYDLLLKKIGFDTMEELVNYLNSEAECDTLHEAIVSLEHNVKFARDERRGLSKKLDECEKDYISARDKVEALQTENEQLKKKLHEYDPISDFKELFKKLHSIEDTEELEWVLNHACGGRGSVNGWMACAKSWKQNYEALSKLVGFSSKEEVEDYLVNEAECDTLHEAILKLTGENKYACEEWCKANSGNNSWKAAAECNSPKELIEKRETLEKENAYLYAEIRKWKEMTKCETPEAAATWITSYESACGRGNRLAEMVEKLKEEVVSWKNVTGYSIPEDYMHARISGAFHTPFDYTAAWQKATGCDTPEQAKERIKALNERIDESEACYNHLLNLTGFESEGEIEDALDKCDHSTLRKALVDYEFDYESLLKLTGYKSEQDIRAALDYSEQFVYETLRELINSLKRKEKFTEANWQKVTGFSTPEKCSSYIDRLEKKLEDIKNLTEED